MNVARAHLQYTQNIKFIIIMIRPSKVARAQAICRNSLFVFNSLLLHVIFAENGIGYTEHRLRNEIDDLHEQQKAETNDNTMETKKIIRFWYLSLSRTHSPKTVNQCIACIRLIYSPSVFYVFFFVRC